MLPPDAAASLEASLERAAERGDPTDAVYALLFARYPRMEVHFWRDTTGAVRGSMLSRTFEAILDLAGENRFAAQMIRNELVTHEGYDIPRDAYAAFFTVVRDALRAELADAWTPAFDSAWGALLAEVAGITGATAAVPERSAHFEQVVREWEDRGLQRLREAG